MKHAHNEAGMTLIELLIAMTLMAVGIAAIVAGFSSGIFAIDRASKASTAAALADTAMESYRQQPWTSICSTGSGSSCSVTGQVVAALQTGADGKRYWVGTTISWDCPVGSVSNATNPPTCPGPPTSSVLKRVYIEVHDPTNTAGSACVAGTGVSCTGRLYYNEVSTFDKSTS